MKRVDDILEIAAKASSESESASSLLESRDAPKNAPYPVCFGKNCVKGSGSGLHLCSDGKCDRMNLDVNCRDGFVWTGEECVAIGTECSTQGDESGYKYIYTGNGGCVKSSDCATGFAKHPKDSRCVRDCGNARIFSYLMSDCVDVGAECETVDDGRIRKYDKFGDCARSSGCANGYMKHPRGLDECVKECSPGWGFSEVFDKCVERGSSCGDGRVHDSQGRCHKPGEGCLSTNTPDLKNPEYVTQDAFSSVDLKGVELRWNSNGRCVPTECSEGRVYEWQQGGCIEDDPIGIPENMIMNRSPLGTADGLYTQTGHYQSSWPHHDRNPRTMSHVRFVTLVWKGKTLANTYDDKAIDWLFRFSDGHLEIGELSFKVGGLLRKWYNGDGAHWWRITEIEPEIKGNLGDIFVVKHDVVNKSENGLYYEYVVPSRARKLHVACYGSGIDHGRAKGQGGVTIGTMRVEGGQRLGIVTGSSSRPGKDLAIYRESSKYNRFPSYGFGDRLNALSGVFEAIDAESASLEKLQKSAYMVAGASGNPVRNAGNRPRSGGYGGGLVGGNGSQGRGGTQEGAGSGWARGGLLVPGPGEIGSDHAGGAGGAGYYGGGGGVRGYYRSHSGGGGSGFVRPRSSGTPGVISGTTHTGWKSLDVSNESDFVKKTKEMFAADRTSQLYGAVYLLPEY